MRLAVDTGGTFTDLIIEDDDGEWSMYKSPTTPDDPVEGVLEVLDLGAHGVGITRRALLGAATHLVYGTTLATNALVTHSTARTAFLVTEGFPDILVFREGGRTEPFNFARAFPDPYIPRRLTFEVSERIGAAGEVVRDLDEVGVRRLIGTLRRQQVEAVAVCLLWSIMNPIHERRIGEILEELLPGTPYTLSHELNPIVREYRRASSAAIDASLKPLMTQYLNRLEKALEVEGFQGRLLMVTSGGGILDAKAVALAPIHSVASGPAMAPVAGKWFAQIEADADTAVIADTGGTSYDVSVVRRGRIPWTETKRLGADITGFPAVDVKSIGAGGGSIAWVDRGGLLHVGPESAGAVPGPACYARGGAQPTLTDACLVLGYVDPQFFLGGSMTLDVARADEAVGELAQPLGLSTDEAAAAIVQVATEQMVQAIGEITITRGIDPRGAVLVGGGGAAGLNSVAIARRLGCSRVIFPSVGAVLSAAGGLMSDLRRDFSAAYRTTSADFDFSKVNEILHQLTTKCETFIAGPGADASSTTIDYIAQARYPHQVWEIDVPLRRATFRTHEDVQELRRDLHALHRDVFAVDDRESEIEIVAWRAIAICRLARRESTFDGANESRAHGRRRLAYFADQGKVEASIRLMDELEVGRELLGPAIIEAPVTTIVIDPGASAFRTEHGAVIVNPIVKGLS